MTRNLGQAKDFHASFPSLTINILNRQVCNMATQTLPEQLITAVQQQDDPSTDAAPSDNSKQPAKEAAAAVAAVVEAAEAPAAPHEQQQQQRPSRKLLVILHGKRIDDDQVRNAIQVHMLAVLLHLLDDACSNAPTCAIPT